jgi:hypothetical protein
LAPQAATQLLEPPQPWMSLWEMLGVLKEL